MKVLGFILGFAVFPINAFAAGMVAPNTSPASARTCAGAGKALQTLLQNESTEKSKGTAPSKTPDSRKITG